MNVFLAQCGYCGDKRKILDIVNEGVNSKTRSLLEYWGFLANSIDEAWYLLELIAWDSFEFKKASRISRYLFSDPCAFYTRSYYVPFWFGLCNSSDYEINLCPYHACYVQPDFASPSDNTNIVLNLLDSFFPLD